MNPILLNLHVLGAGFSLAVAVFAAAFLGRKSLSAERLNIARTFIKATAVAIIWLIISGAGLFAQRPQSVASTVLFWVKVGLLSADIILGFFLANRKLNIMESAKSEKLIKPTSLIIWIVVNIIVIIIVSALSINIGT